MNGPANTVYDLIPRALESICQARRAGLSSVQADASQLENELKARLRFDGQPIHRISFELGQASLLKEVLGMAARRLGVGEQIGEDSSGQRILRQISNAQRTLGRAPMQRELAEQMGMDAGNLSRKLRRLVGLGLLEALRVGKSVTYSITAVGKAQLRLGSSGSLATINAVTGMGSAVPAAPWNEWIMASNPVNVIVGVDHEPRSAHQRASDAKAGSWRERVKALVPQVVATVAVAGVPAPVFTLTLQQEVTLGQSRRDERMH